MPDTVARSALVTAAGSGLGAEIARKLRSSGVQVLVTDVDEQLLQQWREVDPEVRTDRVDAADPEATQTAVARAHETFGRVDIVVNNAGIPGPRVPIEEIDPETWRQVFEVNLHGAFYAMRAAIPLMKSQRSGVIVNISSTSARTGLPNRSAYVASKVALEGLTRNAARELGPFNIRCNAVLPGYMDNPRGRALITRHAEENGISEQAARDKFLRFISMRSMIGMHEVAGMVAFLCSDEAAHVSGQCIGVCGNQEYEV
jgi:NAD(P)-dependent dehydrogenase (short-subunit alcohol dehydrogenase family)